MGSVNRPSHPLPSRALPIRDILDRALAGERLTEADAIALIECPESDLGVSSMRRRRIARPRQGPRRHLFAQGFLPVTNLCRDRCTYCTFRKDPGDPDAWTMMPDEIADWSRRGRDLGCNEALMCLGDKPEVAFKEYRETLNRSACAPRSSTCAALASWPWRGSAAAYQRRRDELRRDGDAAAAQRQHGPDARKYFAAAAPTRRGPSMGARQGTGAADADDRGSRAAQDPVHHRNPARNRRDGRRARAKPDRDSRRASSATAISRK